MTLFIYDLIPSFLAICHMGAISPEAISIQNAWVGMKLTLLLRVVAIDLMNAWEEGQIDNDLYPRLHA